MENKEKKKISKKVLTFAIVGVLSLILVSAAVILYFGQIKQEVTVSQGLNIDGHSWNVPIISGAIAITSLEEKNVVASHIMTNSAGIDANVSLNSVCEATNSSNGCNEINTSYYVTSKDSIVSIANRLIILQNTGGSWGWVVTSATGPTSENLLNIAGVTAESLLKAYEITGNSSYLNAAKKTGDYLIVQYGSDGSLGTLLVSGGKNINAFNINFLYDLWRISGETKYKTEADVLMNKVITAYPTASTLVAHDIAYRGTGYGRGIVFWDLYKYIENAKSVGNTIWANDLKVAIEVQAPLSNTDLTYVIGLSGLILATGNTDAINALIANQSGDGSWTDFNGNVQNTVYAIIALKSVGDFEHALRGQLWLEDKLDSDRILESDNNEYAEVDSEVIQAVPFKIMNSQYILGAGQKVDFIISSHFPKMMIPATYTITTTVK